MSDQEKPTIAQKSPYVIEMNPGTYYWCACGRSTNQPFCNGAHKGTGITPKKVEFAEKKTVHWCGCKHSASGHQCDGTHRKL